MLKTLITAGLLFRNLPISGLLYINKVGIDRYIKNQQKLLLCLRDIILTDL